MELVPTVDIECINNPIQVSLCDDSSVVDTEFGGESHSVAVDGKVNDDEATQQHHGRSWFFYFLYLFYRVHSVQLTCSRPTVRENTPQYGQLRWRGRRRSLLY